MDEKRKTLTIDIKGPSISDEQLIDDLVDRIDAAIKAGGSEDGLKKCIVELLKHMNKVGIDFVYHAEIDGETRSAVLFPEFIVEYIEQPEIFKSLLK